MCGATRRSSSILISVAAQRGLAVLDSEILPPTACSDAVSACVCCLLSVCVRSSFSSRVFLCLCAPLFHLRSSASCDSYHCVALSTGVAAWRGLPLLAPPLPRSTWLLPELGAWLGDTPAAPTYNLRAEFSINLPEEVACAALSLRLAADGIVQSVTLNAKPIPLPSAPNASYSIALEANAGFGGFLLGNNILDVVLHRHGPPPSDPPL